MWDIVDTLSCCYKIINQCGFLVTLVLLLSGGMSWLVCDNWDVGEGKVFCEVGDSVLLSIVDYVSILSFRIGKGYERPTSVLADNLNGKIDS